MIDANGMSAKELLEMLRTSREAHRKKIRELSERYWRLEGERRQALKQLAELRKQRMGR